jgi:hypothetical protein
MEIEIGDTQESEVCSPHGLSRLRLLPGVGSNWNWVYEDRALCEVLWRLWSVWSVVYSSMYPTQERLIHSSRNDGVDKRAIVRATVRLFG